MRAQEEAEARRLLAEAEAQAIAVKGQAEADTIEAKAKALSENPNLVRLISTERWNGSLPTTMVPNGALPFIDVK